VSGAEKRHPYAGLTDQELNELVGEAADLRLRLAMLSPGEVAETLIAHGMPERSAREQVRTPGLRTFAAKFHLDTVDAKLGDRAAAERVEHCRAGWARMSAGREAV
jgi:hypothetical protein